MYEALPLALCACLLLIAAGCDVANMQIPNWISIVLAGVFPFAALYSGNFDALDIGLHLGFGAAILMAGFLLFQVGVLGGGDAKLIAATAVWTGLTAFAQFALWTTLAGGLLALSLLVARKTAQPADTRPAYLNRLLTPRGGMPYGVAIAFGAIVALQLDAIANSASALTTP